jgi:hypothetical protein
MPVTGFTQIATGLLAASYTTPVNTVAPGVGYYFVVTGVNLESGYESGQSNQAQVSIPATDASPTVSLTWQAGSGDQTFNVYMQEIVPPNPPVNLTATINA